MKISSILKKVLVGITGIGLFGFLVGHLAGNLLIFGGAGKFNAYAKMLESNPMFLIPVEIGLLAFFLLHIYLALTVTRENRAARPKGYEVEAAAGDSNLASRMMPVTGILVAIFVVTHVWMFKFGDSKGALGLYGLVVRSFENPLIAAAYILAMVLLGMHLAHGIASFFQTIGVLKPDWRQPSRKIGMAIGWAIALGFALLPAYVFVTKPSAKAQSVGGQAEELVKDVLNKTLHEAE